MTWYILCVRINPLFICTVGYTRFSRSKVFISHDVCWWLSSYGHVPICIVDCVRNMNGMPRILCHGIHVITMPRLMVWGIYAGSFDDFFSMCVVCSRYVGRCTLNFGIYVWTATCSKNHHIPPPQPNDQKLHISTIETLCFIVKLNICSNSGVVAYTSYNSLHGVRTTDATTALSHTRRVYARFFTC